MALTELEKNNRALRKIARLDREFPDTIISISIRNGARGSGIDRRGAWGRNVNCYHCKSAGRIKDKNIGWNNETGSKANNHADEVAGRHLLEFHADRVVEVEALKAQEREELREWRARQKAAAQA